MFGFENLEVWQKALAFADEVYRITAKFPSDEKFGLTSQLRRASVSISSNVAEGSSRSSKVDFARFVEIAYGSLMECVSQLHVAKRQGFVDDAHFTEAISAADRLSRMLSGLRASLVKKDRT